MRAAFAVPTGGGRDSAHSSNAAGESHVFTSSLFSGSSASPARRPMDLLRGRAGASNPQVAPTTRDQALADHQLQTLVRTKGASILRQRLLFLLRKQFEKEFDEIDDFFANGGTLATPAAAPTGKHAKTSSSSSKQQQQQQQQQQASGEAGDDTLPQALRILHQVEDLLISCDNSDVENAGYLRDYAKKVNRPEKKPAATKSLSSKRSATKGNSDDEEMDEDEEEEDDFLDDDDEDFDDDGILGGGASSKKRRDQPILGGAVGGGAMMATPSFILQASSFSSSVNLTAAAGAAAPQTGNSAAHPAPAAAALVSRPATGGDSRFGIASTTVVSDSECSSTDDVISPSKATRGAANSSGKPSAATTTAGKAGTTTSSSTTPSAKDSSSGTSTKKDGGSEWSAGALDRDYSGVKPTNEFYAIRVKRTPGTGSVACPKCLRDLSDLPSNLPTQVVVADACTNTAERSDSEKDFLVASLTKAKQDAEKKMEEIRKELVAFKKMKYANSNFATPSGAAAGTPSSSPNGKLVSNQSFSLGDGAMDCTGPLSPVRAASAMGMMDEGPPLPPVRASSSMGFGAAPTSNAWANANSSNASSSSQSAASQRVGKDSRTTTTATGSKRASSGAVRRGGGGGEVPNPAQSTPPDSPPPPPVFQQQQQSDAQQQPPHHHHHTNRKPLPIHELLRMNTALKDLRAKLQGIRAGVKSFQFREVFQQFSQHVIPQAQLLQSANRRLLDRDYILEKLLLDALCKIGTMPDAGSPEGYLPDGGPLHVGTYSLLDDRRFLEWTRRIGDTLTAKVSAVQGYLQTLSTEVRTLQSGSNCSSSSSSGAARGDGGGGGNSDTTITLNRKEQLLLEDRVQLLESSLVEHECFNVSNTLDHTFDSSSAVQSSRRAEFVTLLKQAAETNEEIRLVYVVPGWCAKPPLRVKMNMWRQRRLESLQKVEQVLSQEMQHYVSTGAQKVVLKGKLMTLRELIQLASKIMVMPPSANVFGAGHALAQRDAGGGSGAATAGATWKMISSPPAVVPLTPPSDLLPPSSNHAAGTAASSASARSEGEHSSSSVSYEAPSAGPSQAAPASLPLNGGMLPSSSATTMVAGSPTRLYGGGGVSDALRMSGSFSGLSLSNSQQAQPASSTSSSVVLSPTSAAAHNEKLAAAILNSKDPLRLRSPPTISSASSSGGGGSASTGANSSSSTKRTQGSSRLPPMKN